LVVVMVGAVGLALAGGAVFAWPRVGLRESDTALARIALPGYGGTVTDVSVRDSSGVAVPVSLRKGNVWPLQSLASGERLTLELTVRRPGWAGWLVGARERRTFTVVTPKARLLQRWLQVRPGAPVTVSFDEPVSRVAIGQAAPRLIAPRSVVALRASTGAASAGSIEVAATARSWERLPAPTRVSWFPAHPYPQVLAKPTNRATLRPNQQIVLTFSQPVSATLGTARPRLSPATPGRWLSLDAHTIAFQPTGLGYPLGSELHLALPHLAHLAGTSGPAVSQLGWQVRDGSILRLQQLLAQLGYLPVTWHAAADPPSSSASSQVSAAISPPQGRFGWRYANTPPELRALWQPGRPNAITRAALMSFENTHHLAVDGIAGPIVWHTLLTDAIAGKPARPGYGYVFVHTRVPQSLNLWHNGRVILRSPGNTGVPAAPTQLGTFPVFEHIPVGTMSGTNPDGSHYHDPGIRYISYFHHGDAIHAFNRASYGTPQSLGCVELPLAAAAKVWPYTPIGTLVTIEN
jgi:hypothetical protein